MPIQSVEFWEEKTWLAEEAAETMSTPAAKAAMLEIAQLYRKLAEQTRKLKEASQPYPPALAPRRPQQAPLNSLHTVNQIIASPAG